MSRYNPVSVDLGMRLSYGFGAVVAVLLFATTSWPVHPLVGVVPSLVVFVLATYAFAQVVMMLGSLSTRGEAR